MKNIIKKLGFWCIRNKFVPSEFRMLRNLTELAALRELLDQLRINVVLDVGANKGWYAEQLRKIGYSGYIFSFEPVLEDFRIIEKKSSTDEKWIAVNKAVGDKDEIKQFNVIESGDEKQTVLSSFLNSSNFEIAKVVDVEVIRLDGFKDQILTELEELRIFLKTDTQGYDLNVWRGAEAIYPMIKALQSEISVVPIYENAPHYTESLETFERDGMELKSLNVVHLTKTGAVLEYDCIMYRPDSLN